MRACELMKETFFRRTISGSCTWSGWPATAASGGFFCRTPEDWASCLFSGAASCLPLALSAGIFGDDIASGRICVLVTKPFWTGELYLYRFLGLSVQGAVHFGLAACLVLVLHVLTRRGSLSGVGWWLLAAWLLFNTFAALSASLSVVVKRAHNSLLLFGATLTLSLVGSILIHSAQGSVLEPVVTGFFRYPFPPFELLHALGKGDYVKETLTLGSWHLAQGIACALHSLLLTAVYGGVGVLLLTRREFLSQRE